MKKKEINGDVVYSPDDGGWYVALWQRNTAADDSYQSPVCDTEDAARRCAAAWANDNGFFIAHLSVFE